MKQIILPLAIVVAGSLFSACSEDRLDVEQKSANTPESFYKTNDDAESAVVAMYSTFNGEIAGTEGIWNAYIMGLNYSSDDVFAAGGDTHDHADFRILNEFRYDQSSLPIRTLYAHIYKSIYSANLVIQYFGGTNANTEIKKHAVAQARVMRAWAHMLAALVYYQPPIVDKIVTKYDHPTNAESQKAILDWCVKECEEAMSDLPERNGQKRQTRRMVCHQRFRIVCSGQVGSIR